MSRSFLPTALATVLAACTLMSFTAGADDNRRSWRSDGHRYSDRRYDDNDRYDRRDRREHRRDYRRDDRRWHRNHRYDHRWSAPRHYRYYPRHYRYYDPYRYGRGYHQGWYGRHYGHPSRYDYYPRGNGSLIVTVPLW